MKYLGIHQAKNVNIRILQTIKEGIVKPEKNLKEKIYGFKKIRIYRCH